MPDTPRIEMDALFKELVDGVFVCSKSGELVYANPAFGKILGYSEDKVPIKNVANDVVDRELEWHALTSLMDQGSAIRDYEINLRRSDGSKIVASLSATFFRDTDGDQFAIAGVIRDITTRKGVENDLREKAFRTDIVNKMVMAAGTSKAVENILNGLGGDLKMLVPFEKISLGSTEEKGRHVDVLMRDQEDASKTRKVGRVPFEGSLIEKLKYDKNAVIIEKDVARRNFTEFDLIDLSGMNAFLSVPLRSRGKIIGSLNIAHSKAGEYSWETAEVLQDVANQLAGLVDNTILLNSLEEKVELHESLLDSGVQLQKAVTTQQIYAAIASHLRDIVPYQNLSFYLIDWPNRWVYPVYAVGSFADEIMDSAGILDEGIVGSIAKSGRAEFVDDVDEDHRVAQISGVPAEHESMLAIPLSGMDGVVGVIEVYRERGQVFSMSDLEAGLLFAQQASVALVNSQMVSKLQEAKKEIELLNDLMFHDINNYNFATINYVENIADSEGLPADAKMALEKALNLLRKTSRLIEDVKKLTKIGGMDQSEFVQINLCDVLAKVTSGLAHSAPNKTVSFKVDLPEQEAIVMANSLVDELFSNVISNAIKYDPHEDVEIDVTCSKVLVEGVAFWKTAITDRGQGIPDEMKSSLFQKYVRLRPESTVSGTGLGLSIVSALTDKFNGRVWMEDRVPGRSDQGAKFCIELPAAKPASR
ncbi:MAG: GAF domain-containing protein [Methanobacteriota archaeon]|nr:MAG: GAF domain-containing protein [Euryarchaeota archaeon]